MSILVQEFEKLKKDLITAYDQKGMRASGEFAESLEVVERPNGVQLWGAGHAVQLEYGRGTTQTTTPSTPTLKEKILQWIDDKGITPDDISKESLAFLIARKIHEQGWDRQGRGGVGLISEVVSDERIDKIINAYKREVSEQYIAILTDKIRAI